MVRVQLTTMDGQHLRAACLIAAVSAMLYFIAKFYAARERMWKMQRANLPMPRFSFLAGHFPVLGKIMRSLPSDSIIHNIMWRISQDYPNGIFYLSLWPFSGTVMVIADADAAAQLEGSVLAKGTDIVHPLEKITGGRSLLTMTGYEWKRWRRLFNPGFSPAYMMGLAPAIADEVAVFRRKLLDRCDGGKGRRCRSEVFLLEDLTLKLTFDIIGSVVLDAQLRNQVQEHPMSSTLRKQIEWTSFREPLTPLTALFTIRPLVQWFNGRKVDAYISDELDKRLAQHSDEKPSPVGTSKSRSVASLFIDEYRKEMRARGAEPSNEVIKDIITPQVRLFLFAGHDTTSSTLQYCYYLLWRNPQVLGRVIAEHDEVFGRDSSRVRDIIHEDTQVLNRIPYTTAFIKEVLRIFPPAGAMRQGRSDMDIIDADGRAHPTEGCNVWTLTLAIHHNPRHWKDAEDCIPERWLVGPEDPLYPPKGAWRPFEFGPRSCIGQTLAMVELKVALAMTAREISIAPAYDEWDEIHPRKGAKTVNGDRVYQAVVGGGGAHPADGFPVRVELRKPKASRNPWTLDQLGLYDDILAKAQPVETMIVRDGRTGKRIMTHKTRQLMTEGHGYPCMFMECYELLCVIYAHLKDKHGVFCDQKVSRVDSLPASAKVYTQNGSVFEGQIVVGADGVRSTIRREMRRNADAGGDSAAIPARDRADVPCEHACIFGTAKPTPGINPGEVMAASGRNKVAGCMGGPGSEGFVIWFWSLPKGKRTCPIDDIPRFDDEDKKHQFERGADTLVSDAGLRFDEVRENLIYSSVTALPHFAMRRWHYGRLVIIGDAAHKSNPLIGQGGNSCIESCASLVNALQEQGLIGPNSADAWDLSSVGAAFSTVEKQRVDRLVDMVESCQDAMRSSAWETWKLWFPHRWVLPMLPLEKYVDYYSLQTSGGLSVASLDPSAAAHNWPYADEKTVEEKNEKKLWITEAGVAATIPVAALTAFVVAKVLRSEHGIGGSMILSRVPAKLTGGRQ